MTSRWRVATGPAADPTTPAGRSRERYRRIALTVTSGMAARAVSIAVNLLLVSLLLAHLGKERFGFWSALMSTVVWLGLWDLGLGSGLVNVVAEAHGRDDPEAAAQAVSTAFAALSGAALVLAVGLAMVLPRISWDLAFGAAGVVDAGTARQSVTAAVAVFAAGLPFSIAPAIYAGYQKSYVVNAVLAAGSILTLAVAAVLMRTGAGLPALIVALSAGGVLVNGVCLLVIARAQLPWVVLRARQVSRQAWRRLLRTAQPLLVFNLGALMVNQSQLFTLAHTTSLDTVADYSVIVRILQVFSSLMLLTTGAFLPSYREAVERGDGEWVRTGFLRMVAARLTLASGFSVLLVVFGNPLLRLWLQRSDIAFPPLVWAALGLSLLAGAWVSAHSDLLIILDRIWMQVVLVMVNGIVTVFLTWWWSRAYGVLGVIAASACVTVLVWTWLLPRLARPVLAAGASGIGSARADPGH